MWIHYDTDAEILRRSPVECVVKRRVRLVGATLTTVVRMIAALLLQLTGLVLHGRPW